MTCPKTAPRRTFCKSYADHEALSTSHYDKRAVIRSSPDSSSFALLSNLVHSTLQLCAQHSQPPVRLTDPSGRPDGDERVRQACETFRSSFGSAKWVTDFPEGSGFDLEKTVTEQLAHTRHREHRSARIGGRNVHTARRTQRLFRHLSDGNAVGGRAATARSSRMEACDPRGKGEDRPLRRRKGFDPVDEDDHSIAYCRGQAPLPVELKVRKGSHHVDQFIFRTLTGYTVPGEHCLPPKP